MNLITLGSESVKGHSIFFVTVFFFLVLIPMARHTAVARFPLRWCYTGQLATPTGNADAQRMFFARICRHVTLLNRFQILATRCSTANIAQKSSAAGCYTRMIFRATSYHCKLALQVDQCNTTFSEFIQFYSNSTGFLSCFFRHFLPLPRLINFRFTPQPHQKCHIIQCETFQAFYSLLR